MEPVEPGNKRKRSSSEDDSLSGSDDQDGFEIPKEHLRNAKKREKVLRASAVIQKAQNRTSISDVRNVVLWILSESHGTMPKWCMIRNKNLVSGVTVIITPFVDRQTLFELAGSSVSATLPFISHSIRGSLIPMTAVSAHRYPAVCPVLSTFLSSPSSSKPGQWIVNLSDNEEERAGDTSELLRPKIDSYLMTEENRRLHDMPEALAGGYPAPGFLTTRGKKTRQVGKSVDGEELAPMLVNAKDQAWIEQDADYSNLIGLDCEMVETVSGKELARVSLIDHCGRVLYDSIVLPESEITDYITQYSGITAKMIRECRTTFKEAQRQVLAFLDENSILVGHAIDNDLRCLRLVHERIIDTSDIFPHPNGYPSKHSLVFLLQRVLRETLDREGGHDSVDDARATLRIAMKKFARGPDYSPAGMGCSSYHPLASLVQGPTALFVDQLDNPDRYKLTGVSVNPESAEEAKLRIHVLRDFQTACEESLSRTEALVSIDKRIREILKPLDDNHIVVTFSGCGDVHSFKRFELLADKCEDETKRVEVTKMLQRAKDRAVSAFAMICSVGDLPAHIRNTEL
jgi:RNA exonuclease 1